MFVDDPRFTTKPAFCEGAVPVGTSEFKMISLSAMFNSCVFTVVTVPFIVRFLLIITSPLSVKFCAIVCAEAGFNFTKVESL